MNNTAKITLLSAIINVKHFVLFPLVQMKLIIFNFISCSPNV